MKTPAPSVAKRLLSGNEAIALGAWEAGVRYAAAYPGTPSTEILPALARYAGVQAEWSSNEKVGKLSGGERQSIAIGRAVHFGAKLLILDEPTSALSVAESRKVLDYTLNAKERGLSVIFITHNVHHVMAVADRYTVIRRAENVGTYRRGEVSFDDISDLITGEREC